MPLEVMNRELYADRTVQDWHRFSLPSDHDAIDVDLMGVCRRGFCRDPLYFIEATTNPNKPATILRRLAEKAGGFGIVVVHDTNAIIGFTIVHDPSRGRITACFDDAESRLSDILKAIRHNHSKTVHGAV